MSVTSAEAPAVRPKKGQPGWRQLQRRRRALLAAPILVPVSMAGAFAVLDRLLGPRRGYHAGFALYWAGWCLAFPRWVVGPRRLVGLLREGARPSPADLALLALPVAGRPPPNWCPTGGRSTRRWLR
jgi:hypothetical protein